MHFEHPLRNFQLPLSRIRHRGTDHRYAIVLLQTRYHGRLNLPKGIHSWKNPRHQIRNFSVSKGANFDNIDG